MALHLLVILEREQVDQGLEETRLDDRRLVLGVNRDITDTGSGRQDKGKIGRLKQAQQGGETISLDNLKLIFLCRYEIVIPKFNLIKGIRTIASQIPERQSRLTLNLEAGTSHELHEAGDQLGLGLGKLLPVVR